MDIERRLEVVEQENDMLRALVRRLENALVAMSPLPLEWSLTQHETMVLGVLVNRQLATKEAIMAALYRSLGKDEAEPKIVDVYICKIRKKLKPYGVEIETHWGIGYSLDGQWRSRLAVKEAA